MASKKSKKPVSPSERAKKGWKTRRRNIKAKRVGEEIFETWGRLGGARKKEASTRKKASNSRIYGEAQERIAQLESEAREAEKERKRLEREVEKLKREAETLHRLQGKGYTKREQQNIVESVELTRGREGWVNVMPEKYIRQDGGIALNPCRLRHTTETTRWQDLFRQAEEQDGGQIAGPSVQAVIKRIRKEYEDQGYSDYFPDEEPLEDFEIWTLYFSP